MLVVHRDENGVESPYSYVIYRGLIVFRKSALLVFILLFGSLIASAANDSVRQNLQEAISARYRLTQIGSSLLGIHGGPDSIRKLGGTLIVTRKGLYGSQERSEITSNSIKSGQRTLLSGKEDVALLPGERFYANNVFVGDDFVQVGLLSVDPRNFQGRMARVWSAVTFFFDRETISSGDLNKINAAMDQWILPADSIVTVPHQATLAARIAATPLAPSINLKSGATREEIETGLGKPMQTIAFGNQTWLTYPGLVAVLEDGKLSTVERTEQAFGNLSLGGHSGAEIYIDGELSGTTPTTLRVPTGSHKVELKLDGKSIWQEQVHVFPGAEVNLKPTASSSGQ